MNAPRGPHNSGDGSFARDAGTQTTKAIVLVVIAAVVAVLALSKLTSPSHPSVAAGQGAATTTTTATTSSTLATTTTTTTPPPAPATVKVAVFNGTTAPHGAGYFTTKLRALNYNTLAPENGTTTTVTTSLVYVNVPGFMSSAVNIAQALGLPSTAVQPSLPSTAPVPSALVKASAPDVVVLVGSDISGQSLGTTTSSSTSAA